MARLIFVIVLVVVLVLENAVSLTVLSVLLLQSSVLFGLGGYTRKFSRTRTTTKDEDD